MKKRAFALLLAALTAVQSFSPAMGTELEDSGEIEVSSYEAEAVYEDETLTEDSTAENELNIENTSTEYADAEYETSLEDESLLVSETIIEENSYTSEEIVSEDVLSSEEAAADTAADQLSEAETVSEISSYEETSQEESSVGSAASESGDDEDILEDASDEDLLSSDAFVGAGPGGAPGSSGSVTWSGATTITSSKTTSNKTYSSVTADQNAVLINTSGSVTLKNPTVTKSGGTSASDNYSFYGINSAVMCKGGGTTTITGGTVTTTAEGANGIFSYGANSGQTNASGDGTTVNISNTTINTTGGGSGGIMTTFGGTTVANNLTVTTSGGSSAPIRTDRGGGWVTVNGGTYTSSGTGSPAIYSTADVDVSNATLVSKASEGVCIEGTGSIELTDCNLTATNNKLNGNAQFYDTIMIYQSMSGDASSGTSAFSMTGGTLTSNNGHVFHVTNTTCSINLTGVNIVNNDSGNVLISVCDDGWSGGSNSATLTAKNQTLTGKLLVGSDSTLNLYLTGTSTFTGTSSGAIKNAKNSTVSSSLGTLNVTMSDSAAIVLTGNTKVSSLSGSGYINYNGYTLTVGSKKYSSGNIGNIVEVSSSDTSASTTDTTSTETSSSTTDTSKKAVITAVYNSVKGADIHWQKTSGATGYIVYCQRAAEGTRKVAVISNPDTVQCYDTAIKTNCWGRVYHYYVRARFGSTLGPASNKLALQRIAPVKITKAVNSSSNSASLSWACTVSSNKAYGYQIQYASSYSDLVKRSGSYNAVTVTGRNNLSKTITGLTKGKTWWFRVRCYVNYTNSTTGNKTKTWSQYSSIVKVKITK